MPKTDRKVKKEKKPPRVRPYPQPSSTTTTTAPRAFVKQPVHAKWPSLFKRHLGLIESQIKVYDRLMQSMRSEMDQMEPEEQGRWERGEEGHWHTLCGMMRRARGMLDDARTAGAGILPAEKLKEKKSLGMMGLEFEPLGVDGKPVAQGDSTKKLEDSSSSDSDSSAENDTEMSDPDSEAESTKDAPAPEFTPIVAGRKRKLGAEAEEESVPAAQTEVEPNPYFVVDTEPTPVAAPKIKKAKKAKKSKSDAKSEVAQPNVDFAAIERQLQADVEARMRAKDAEAAAFAQKPDNESEEVTKKEKKRKRTSTGSEIAETKKVKKDKKEKKEKKRKGDEENAGSK